MTDSSLLDEQRPKAAFHLELIKKFIRNNDLPESFLSTAWQYYLPFSLNLLQWTQEKRTQSGKSFILGVNGAQGTGKSTLANFISYLLKEFGLTVLNLSIDDFYLTKNERNELAKTIHPLLKTRGVPGTHDINLTKTIIDEVSKPLSQRKNSNIQVPRFNKAIDDRFPNGEDLPQNEVDLIILEGWCIGVKAQTKEMLKTPLNDLELAEDKDGKWRQFINQEIDNYQDLFNKLDYLAMLKAPSFEIIYQWRGQQEEQLLKRQSALSSNSQIMDRTQLQRFIMHYERLSRWMLNDIPKYCDLVFEINEQHSITGQSLNASQFRYYIQSSKLLIVTDLDASLLDENYTWDAAQESLVRLSEAAFPVIFNSSKTLAEMTSLSEKITQQFNTPLRPIIAENGGLIAYPAEGSYNVKLCSIDLEFILGKAHDLRQKYNYQFTGFSDLSEEELSKLTGLDLKSAQSAKDRHATEPILWQDSQDRFQEFKKTLESFGIRVIRGGQFIHLMGPNDKADALLELRIFYTNNQASHHWLIVALGDSPNDKSMLEAADFGVLIPNNKHSDFTLASPPSFLATAHGPKGWQQAIQHIFSSLYGIHF
jgi:D-glycerate 3-kinase